MLFGGLSPKTFLLANSDSTTLASTYHDLAKDKHWATLDCTMKKAPHFCANVGPRDSY